MERDETKLLMQIAARTPSTLLGAGQPGEVMPFRTAENAGHRLLMERIAGFEKSDIAMILLIRAWQLLRSRLLGDEKADQCAADIEAFLGTMVSANVIDEMREAVPPSTASIVATAQFGPHEFQTLSIKARNDGQKGALIHHMAVMLLTELKAHDGFVVTFPTVET